MITLRGKVSHFGGPDDLGVDPDEGLAFYYDVSDAPELFLDQQPPNTTGLARRLDPAQMYIATRWDYDITPKDMLPSMLVTVTNVRTGESLLAVPADWGPHIDTDRCADVSPGVMEALGLQTDDEVIIEYQPLEEVTMPYNKICISSGHGTHVPGACGILIEVDEAIRVMDHLADELRARGVDVETFTDTLSKSQGENLDRIVDWHNSRAQDLALSIHFNAYEQVDHAMGCEVLYVSQSALADRLSAAIASNGFIDRGPKKRTDLAFLNGTEAPACLLEICFVDSEADAELYGQTFNGICEALADELGGAMSGVGEGEGETDPPPTTSRPIPRINIEVDGEVIITVNGEVIT